MQIENRLKELFGKHRLIFWYDAAKDFEEEVRNLSLDPIEIIEVDHNEFGVKYRYLTADNKQRFLLYFPYAEPDPKENWLLDLQLANYRFHTEKAITYLQELQLDYLLKDFVELHLAFFENKNRRKKLKDLLTESENEDTMRQKMIAVTLNTEFVETHYFLMEHANAFLNKPGEVEKELQRYNLWDSYWKIIEKRYGYSGENPEIYDALLLMFRRNFYRDEESLITQESEWFLKQWQNLVQYQNGYKEISERAAKDLDVESYLQHKPLDESLFDRYFALTDMKIIRELTDRLESGKFDPERIYFIVKERESKFWWTRFKNIYKTVEVGARLLHLMSTKEVKEIESFAEGIALYKNELYEVDMLYRQFIAQYRQTNQIEVLSKLAEKVMKTYSNQFLLGWNKSWQTVIDGLDHWPVKDMNSQRSFFNQEIEEYLQKDNRIFVIISDAFRYECAMDFHTRLMGEGRFDAETDAMVASIPSYTQLGMASLLPNADIRLMEPGNLVMVDGQPAGGTENRNAILEKALEDKAIAFQSDTFMNMTIKEGRDFIKPYNVIYIYQNHIDKTGDDKMSEEKVFDAVEAEMEYLTKIIKHIANMNGTNILLTADHGFIYQHERLEESDFANVAISGDVLIQNRRYVIGKNIDSPVLKKFTGSSLGLNEDLDFLFPKSINRLRVKGAGSRFVHGGTSLQEIVVPVMRISKKRFDVTEQVNIDIVQSGNRITTNIVPVSFIQTDAVSSHRLSRQIKAAIYAENGDLISDEFNYTFDSAEENIRKREVSYRFHLSGKASGKYKNQQVKLMIYEPVENSSQWKLYKEYFYFLNISFTSDFD